VLAQHRRSPAQVLLVRQSRHMLFVLVAQHRIA
jgi:hypothetical protein